MIPIDLIKQLRLESEAPLIECRRALEEAQGDMAKARESLKAWAQKKAARLEAREVKDGAVTAYVHAGNKLGVLVELTSETDFVARNEAFQKLGREVAMQVAAMNPSGLDELLAQAYIRDPQTTIARLLADLSAKVGEKITVARFVRFAVGN